jgi:bacterioferritin
MQMNTTADAQKKGPFFDRYRGDPASAREHIEKGAVTPDYKGDRQTVLGVLNEALAT